MEKYINKTGCSHYKHTCAMYCGECNEWFICHRCHNENKEHTFRGEKIGCLKCGVEQMVSKKCVNCCEVFANNYCGICYIWRDDEMYHCDGCGNCRLGRREEYKHCNKCYLCIKVNIYDEHTCAKNADDDCPICLDSIHNSQKRCIVLRCGHCIHRTCLKKLYSSGKSNCLICFKGIQRPDSDFIKRYNDTMDSFIQSSPMTTPTKIKIHCYECENKSVVTEHFVGNKCGECGSYNTLKLNEQPDN